jgi:NTE family protein
MATEQKGRGIVLACQGGGSHTAFTAGVLAELLLHDDRPIRALSGTSGGAVCALLAWSGLLEDDRGLGAARLYAFWNALSRRGLLETLQNDLVVDTLRTLGRLGVQLEVSPYLNPLEASREFLTRIESAVPFDDLDVTPTAPRLLISAADVNTGEFRIFRSHPIGAEPADRITSGTILASSAVPTLFEGVLIDGHLYWDGLFAQNPPVHDLPDAARGEGGEGLPPNELWAILINPARHVGEPKQLDDIRDRRNELAANISFQHELSFIGKINELARRDQLADAAKEKYHPIKVRAITMADDVAAELDYESKISTNPTRIDSLVEHGRTRAEGFLSDLTAPDADDRTAVWSRDIWGRVKDRNWTPLPP